MTETTESLTLAQRSEMRQLVRKFDMSGKPEVAAQIRLCIEQGVMWEGEEVVVEPEETVVAGSGAGGVNENYATTPQPPLHGKGSGKIAWGEYASTVTEIDAEIIETLSKGDLIGMLQANGVEIND